MSFRPQVESFPVWRIKMNIDVDKEIRWARSKGNMGTHSRWIVKAFKRGLK